MVARQILCLTSYNEMCRFAKNKEQKHSSGVLNPVAYEIRRQVSRVKSEVARCLAKSGIKSAPNVIKNGAKKM